MRRFANSFACVATLPHHEVAGNRVVAAAKIAFAKVAHAPLRKQLTELEVRPVKYVTTSLVVGHDQRVSKRQRRRNGEHASPPALPRERYRRPHVRRHTARLSPCNSLYKLNRLGAPPAARGKRKNNEATPLTMHELAVLVFLVCARLRQEICASTAADPCLALGGQESSQRDINRQLRS